MYAYWAPVAVWVEGLPPLRPRLRSWSVRSSPPARTSPASSGTGRGPLCSAACQSARPPSAATTPFLAGRSTEKGVSRMRNISNTDTSTKKIKQVSPQQWKIIKPGGQRVRWGVSLPPSCSCLAILEWFKLKYRGVGGLWYRWRDIWAAAAIRSTIYTWVPWD